MTGPVRQMLSPGGKFLAAGTVLAVIGIAKAQTLLAERFQLGVHKDGKEASGYMLVVAKGGIRMKPQGAIKRSLPNAP